MNFRRFGNNIGWITSIMKRKTLPLSYTNRVLGVKFRWLNFEDLFKFHVELLTKPLFLEYNFLVKSQYCYYISCWTAHKASVFGIQLSSEESVLLLLNFFLKNQNWCCPTLSKGCSVLNVGITLIDYFNLKCIPWHSIINWFLIEPLLLVYECIKIYYNS